MACKTCRVRKLRLPQLFREPAGETITRSGIAELRAGEERANVFLGEPDAGVQRPDMEGGLSSGGW